MAPKKSKKSSKTLSKSKMKNTKGGAGIIAVSPANTNNSNLNSKDNLNTTNLNTGDLSNLNNLTKT